MFSLKVLCIYFERNIIYFFFCFLSKFVYIFLRDFVKNRCVFLLLQYGFATHFRTPINYSKFDSNFSKIIIIYIEMI